MRLGVVGLVVDAHHDRRVDVLAGRGDEHLAGAGSQVGAGGVAGAELAGGLDRDVDGELAPGQLGRGAALTAILCPSMTAQSSPTSTSPGNGPKVLSWRSSGPGSVRR